jgi:hypothetical protein
MVARPPSLRERGGLGGGSNGHGHDHGPGALHRGLARDLAVHAL